MSNFILETSRKCRNWSLIFWILAFPLILVTLFRLILSGAYDVAGQPAKLALKNIPQDSMLQVTLDQLEKQGTIQIVVDHADAILEMEESGDLVVHMSTNGIQQSIIMSIANQYTQKIEIIQVTNTMTSNQHTNYLVEKETITNKSLTYINYFTTLAMGCLSSAYFGLRAISDLQANLSDVAKRLACSSEPKSKLVFKQIISSNLICMSLNVIQILVMKYMLKIDFGPHIILVLMTAFLGTWLGIGIGMTVGGIFTLKYNDKSNLLTAFIMLCNAAAGMMIPHIKYLFRQLFPFLDAINPAALITDSFYQLSFYGISPSYYRMILSMLVIGGIFYFVTFMILRRKRYASL